MVLLEMNSLRGCSMVLLMTVIVTRVYCSEARGGCKLISLVRVLVRMQSS